ncbi:MAG: hypothetical protein BGO41_14825 [Clostridiales bacterium 38-18]|nr:MAG: hypothetical protein BGO41_14825 [Clostridiales bacterium 38-18]
MLKRSLFHFFKFVLKSSVIIGIGLGITYLLDYYLHTGTFLIPFMLGNGCLFWLSHKRGDQKADEDAVYHHLSYAYREAYHEKTINRYAHWGISGVVFTIVAFINFL